MAPEKKARTLMRWNSDIDQFLLVALIEEAGTRGLNELLETAGATLEPQCSAEALKQHVAKVRLKREEAGLPCPPQQARAAAHRLAKGPRAPRARRAPRSKLLPAEQESSVGKKLRREPRVNESFAINGGTAPALGGLGGSVQSGQHLASWGGGEYAQQGIGGADMLGHPWMQPPAAAPTSGHAVSSGFVDPFTSPKTFNSLNAYDCNAGMVNHSLTNTYNHPPSRTYSSHNGNLTSSVNAYQQMPLSNNHSYGNFLQQNQMRYPHSTGQTQATSQYLNNSETLTQGEMQRAFTQEEFQEMLAQEELQQMIAQEEMHKLFTMSQGM